MIIKNKKTTSKTTKTILFASLMMTLMIPIATMNAYGVVPENIPDNQLIERQVEKWKTQYKSTEEFTIRQNAIKEYVNADLQPNGWNQFMVKENIRISNFDTILGQVGHGHELVALFAAKDKVQGNYVATEPVMKFHDWLMSKYNTPTSLAEIDKQITAIVPDIYMHLAIQDVSSFNTMADQGNVPPELVDQDPEYWTMIANIAVCQYDENCDSESMRKALDDGLYKTKDTGISLVDVLNYLLPEAYAITNRPHVDYLYANPNTCDYGTCWRSASGSGTNPTSLSINSNGGHGFGKLYVYSTTCSTYTGASKKVVGSVNMGTVFSFTKTGSSAVSCAVQDGNFSLPNHATSYLWTVTTIHSAWT